MKLALLVPCAALVACSTGPIIMVPGNDADIMPKPDADPPHAAAEAHPDAAGVAREAGVDAPIG